MEKKIIKLNGKHLLVYISATDKNVDNVFVLTADNENFKVDFGGKITETRERKVFKLPTLFTLENPDILAVNKKEFIKKKVEINKSSLDKRFKIVSLIALILLTFSLGTSFYDQQLFIKLTFFLGMGIGVWFFGDYELLQSDKHFIYSMMISILFLGYTIFLKHVLDSPISLIDLGALYPVVILTIQKPARLIYKTFLKREPVIDKPPPTFWDGVYTVILFFALTILPFLIVDFFK